jgi:hypothetical protein
MRSNLCLSWDEDLIVEIKWSCALRTDRSGCRRFNRPAMIVLQTNKISLPPVMASSAEWMKD